MTQMKVEVTGIKRANKLIKAYKFNHHDWEVVMKDTGIQAVAWINKNFETEGAHSGKPWKQLKESTVKGRRKGKGKKRVGMTKILQDTGTSKQSTTFRMLFERAVPGVIVGLGPFYSKFHEDGKGVPQRKILPVKKVADRFVMKAMIARIRANVRRRSGHMSGVA